MADIFTSHDAQKIVEFRIIWLLGDSNIRAIYKDLIWLIQKNTLISLDSLKHKLEPSFMNDLLIKGDSIHKGRNYTEIRHFKSSAIPTDIEFTFLTECLNDHVRDKIKHLQPAETPDIIIMNSCLWDITRWGPDGVQRYKKNIKELLKLFQDYLPSKTLVIWTTTPPLSVDPHGGFLIEQLNFMRSVLRFHVMEANLFLKEEVVAHGFNLLDVHFHLMLHIHRRRRDGIHWSPEAVRYMTNLLLTHISLSLKISLPRNFSSPILDEMIAAVDQINSGSNNKNCVNINTGEAVILHGSTSCIKEPLKQNSCHAEQGKQKKRRKRWKNRCKNSDLLYSGCIPNYGTATLPDFGVYLNDASKFGRIRTLSCYSKQYLTNGYYWPY